MTIKLPVDVNTLDDETADALRKALDERKKYVPFVGEIIEVREDDCSAPDKYLLVRFKEFANSNYPVKSMNGTHWRYYRRLDPTRILQFRDHEPGPCPCPDEEWVHVMLKDKSVMTRKAGNLWWRENTGIIRWCPAVGVE